MAPDQVRRFYDRFGSCLDRQAFHEDPALDVLIGHADFATASRVFEFGCGTERLAALLLSRELLASVHYLGCNISPVMTRLASRRLHAFEQASIVGCASDISFPVASRHGSHHRHLCAGFSFDHTHPTYLH
ncbi:MAG: hypothetical protein D6703_00120 [Zetaproteobacteria bacterium]|nr:MAG: hypothetical protein D6703_00120 [Zetaproteobacteria bacterium]